MFKICIFKICLLFLISFYTPTTILNPSTHPPTPPPTPFPTFPFTPQLPLSPSPIYSIYSFQQVRAPLGSPQTMACKIGTGPGPSPCVKAEHGILPQGMDSIKLAH